MKRPRVVPAWRVRMAQRRLDGMLRAAVARCLERERAREPVFVYVDEARDWNELEARVLASYDRGVCLTVRSEVNLAERLAALYGARGSQVVGQLVSPQLAVGTLLSEPLRYDMGPTLWPSGEGDNDRFREM